MESPVRSTIILENGSYTMKAGFSGDDFPQAILPTLCGTLKFNILTNNLVKSKCFIGNEAVEKKGILILDHPIYLKRIENFENVEKLWKSIFETHLKINLKDESILITESPFNSKNNKEKIVTTIFENYNVKKLYIANEAVLPLYSVGKINGIVLDCGEQLSYALPSYEGYAIRNSIYPMYLGGYDVTKYLEFLINKNKKNTKGYYDFNIYNDIKEKLAFASLNYEMESSNRNFQEKYEKQYSLPDGSNITIGKERFQCTELLFHPTIDGRDFHGVSDILFKSVLCCDKESQFFLFQNIVLSGGCTLIEGFKERLEKDLGSIVRPQQKIKVIEESNRGLAVWIGASIFTQISETSQNNINWIYKNEYDEYGPILSRLRFF